ncbi:hypothetical protein CsSME_00011437 [Camellia sinensis var. sinensis]
MRDQISIFITCVAPPEGYVKLNVDGAATGNPRLAGFGGIFCDKASNFKLAFAKKISYITNAMAEMWEAGSSSQDEASTSGQPSSSTRV